MDENNQTQQKNYNQYMGTLNRIYRRGNNPKSKQLGDGIGSLKKGAEAPQPENGKKDRSFQIVMGAVVAVCMVYWAVTTIAQMF